jgi:hypothetical protein
MIVAGLVAASAAAPFMVAADFMAVEAVTAATDNSHESPHLLLLRLHPRRSGDFGS